MSLLRNIVPDTNRFDVCFAPGLMKPDILESAYSPASEFIGVFIDDDQSPSWARRAARYLADEFLFDTPGEKKLLSDVLSDLPSGDGERMDTFRYAIEAYDALPADQRGHPPFAFAQNRGSCVDASCGEHECALFGYRAAHPEMLRERGDAPEAWLHSSAWYKYADRGYCGDGWNGSGIATVARRVGCAFMIPYDLDGFTVDFSDENENENIVGRTWCRSGIPSKMKAYTQANHGYADGAIVRFEGGLKELKAVFAAGGVIHTSGRRTSGGSSPFSVGSVGPHMQSAIGADDSEEIRKWFKDKAGETIDDDDFVVWMNQTWSTSNNSWRGEIADKYWPDWYCRKFPGAWAWRASQVLRLVSCDYAWFPWAKGFPGSPIPPTPVPPTPHPKLEGNLWVDGLAIEGQLTLDEKYEYVIAPSGGDRYRPVPKPSL